MSLYRGIKAPLSSLAAVNAITFGVKGSIMKFEPAQTKSESQRMLWTCFAGCLGGLAQTLLICPMELVKTRAQLTQQSVMQCLRQTCRQEGGLRALYRGYGLTVVRDVPAFGIYFASYEMLLDGLRQTREESTFDVMLAGGTAGALSWLAVYPVDVVKSRLQANLRYGSVRECVRDSLSKEGPKVFLRGCSPTLIRAFPTNAVTFAAITWTLYLYEEHLLNKNTNKEVESNLNIE